MRGETVFIGMAAWQWRDVEPDDGARSVVGIYPRSQQLRSSVYDTLTCVVDMTSSPSPRTHAYVFSTAPG